MSEQRRTTVLVINDVPSVIRLLELELAIGHGFATAGCEVGDAAVEAIERLQPDVIILDILLPGVNGLDMLMELKKRFEIPVLVLTTMDSEADRVRAFDLGADDFMRKPFDPQELGNRVAALVGRAPSQRRMLRFDGYELDLTRQIARRNHTILSLSTNEWAILLALAATPGEVMSTDELARRVGGEYTVAHTGALLYAIDRLRLTVEPDADRPVIVRGTPEEGFTLGVKVEFEP